MSVSSMGLSSTCEVSVQEKLCVFLLLLFQAKHVLGGFPGGSDGKETAYDVEDPGSIPGSGRSPSEGNDNPLQYSCLENFMDRRACWPIMESQRVRHS